VRRAPLKFHRCACEHCSLPRGVHAPLQGSPRMPPPLQGGTCTAGPSWPVPTFNMGAQAFVSPGSMFGRGLEIPPARDPRAAAASALARTGPAENAGVNCRRGVGCEGAGAPGERPRGTAGEGTPPRPHKHSPLRARPSLKTSLSSRAAEVPVVRSAGGITPRSATHSRTPPLCGRPCRVFLASAPPLCCTWCT